MRRKMIAAVLVAGGATLLAPSAAVADDSVYSGPVYSQTMQCIRAWGNTAWAYGDAFPGVEFTVQFRADGASSFNLLDGSADASYFFRSYQRARTGTFKFCARNLRSLYAADVNLRLSTSVESTAASSPSPDEGSTSDPSIGYQGVVVDSGA